MRGHSTEPSESACLADMRAVAHTCLPSLLQPSVPALAKRHKVEAEPLGRGLYRGLLRDLARVWNPREIQDESIQRRVLDHMRSAERGV
jgi:hypothetical protein